MKPIDAAKETTIKRKKIEAGLVRVLTGMLALTVTGGAWAQDNSLAHDARHAGTAIGSAAHNIGVGAKQAGLTIGHDAKKVGLTIGHAAEAGGVAFWHAVKGEKH